MSASMQQSVVGSWTLETMSDSELAYTMNRTLDSLLTSNQVLTLGRCSAIVGPGGPGGPRPVRPLLLQPA